MVAAVVSPDPVLRSYGGLLYIVNRFGADNITIVDPATRQLITQISTGNGSNPQDVAVRGNTLYVAALSSPGIIVLDTDTPGNAPGLIDLSAYDADGVPNLNSVFLAGDRLVATMNLYGSDLTIPVAGKVVVINPDTEEVETDFDLTYKRPIGLLQPTGDGGALGGDLLITTTEQFDDGPGCVERIRVRDGFASRGCLVENAALGGYATVAGTAGDRVWLPVTTSLTSGALISVTAAGEVDGGSLTTAAQQPTDLAVCPTGHLVVNDAREGGLRVFSPGGTELTAAALNIGSAAVFANGLVCL
jgi:YVTN family beta-propeller protein